MSPREEREAIFSDLAKEYGFEDMIGRQIFCIATNYANDLIYFRGGPNTLNRVLEYFKQRDMLIEDRGGYRVIERCDGSCRTIIADALQALDIEVINVTRLYLHYE